MQAHHLYEKSLGGYSFGLHIHSLDLPPMQPLLILSPLEGTPKNAGVT